MADDHTKFGEGLAGILTSFYGEEVEVVGKTNTGKATVVLAQERKPDVLIMEVDRTLNKAKDTLKRIREGSSSPPKVIILMTFEDPQILLEILKLEANAYIHKSAWVEELFAAVRTVTFDTEEGNVLVALPQGALELSEDGLGKDELGSVLSQREHEVLVLVARGRRNQEITSRLGITEATVNAT